MSVEVGAQCVCGRYLLPSQCFRQRKVKRKVMLTDEWLTSSRSQRDTSPMNMLSVPDRDKNRSCPDLSKMGHLTEGASRRNSLNDASSIASSDSIENSALHSDDDYSLTTADDFEERRPRAISTGSNFLLVENASDFDDISLASSMTPIPPRVKELRYSNYASLPRSQSVNMLQKVTSVEKLRRRPLFRGRSASPKSPHLQVPDNVSAPVIPDIRITSDSRHNSNEYGEYSKSTLFSVAKFSFIVKAVESFIESIRQDFSLIEPFDVNNDSVFDVDESFSLKYTRDTLLRFDELFTSLVDTVKEGLKEYLRLTQWYYPVQTLLTFMILMHSVWNDYLINVLLIAVAFGFTKNLLVSRGLILDKSASNGIIDYKKKSKLDSMSNLMTVNMRIAKTFHLLSDCLDKLISLWHWTRPEITMYVYLLLIGGILVSFIVPVGITFKIVVSVLLVKMFILDYIFFRFPRVRAKYDLFYLLWTKLPTGPELYKVHKKQMKAIKQQDEKAVESDQSVVEAPRTDNTPSTNKSNRTIVKVSAKLNILFGIPHNERVRIGWEQGIRCSVINKDRSFASAFKGGKLFLTNNYLLFLRYKQPHPKNLAIPLNRIRSVVKVVGSQGKVTGWLSGDGNSIIIETSTDKCYTFGGVSNFDRVFEELDAIVSPIGNQQSDQ